MEAMRTTWIITAAIAVGGLLAGAPKNPPVADSEQVSKLLSEAKTLAFEVKEDAATMESFTRMNVSWESHATAINQIRDHLNALGKQAAKLREVKDVASPWQRTAIDRITPFLDEMGGYTAAVIEHLNGEKKHNPADYKDYLEANADYSADLAAMIGNFVDYGKTRQKLEHLGATLEIRPAR
jgi:hypothetical protein